MSAHKLGQRMNDYVRAEVNWPKEHRARHGIVYNQRHSVLVSYARQGLYVAYIPRWIPNALAEDGTSVFINQRFYVRCTIRLGKADRNSLARQQMSKQGMRGAV